MYDGGMYCSLHRGNNPCTEEPFPPGTRAEDLDPDTNKTMTGTTSPRLRPIWLSLMTARRSLSPPLACQELSSLLFLPRSLTPFRACPSFLPFSPLAPRSPSNVMTNTTKATILIFQRLVSFQLQITSKQEAARQRSRDRQSPLDLAPTLCGGYSPPRPYLALLHPSPNVIVHLRSSRTLPQCCQPSP